MSIYPRCQVCRVEIPPRGGSGRTKTRCDKCGPLWIRIYMRHRQRVSRYRKALERYEWAIARYEREQMERNDV